MRTPLGNSEDMTEQEKQAILALTQHLMMRDPAYHSDLRKGPNGPAVSEYTTIYNKAAALIVRSASALEKLTARTEDMTVRSLDHWIFVLTGLEAYLGGPAGFVEDAGEQATAALGRPPRLASGRMLPHR